MALLLGFNWLIAVGEIIDVSQITMVLGPSQKVNLCDPLCPQAGYVKVQHKHTLVDRYTTKVHCDVTRHGSMINGLCFKAK